MLLSGVMEPLVQVLGSARRSVHRRSGLCAIQWLRMVCWWGKQEGVVLEEVVVLYQVSCAHCTGSVKPAAGGYFTYTRALKRRDPLDKFQRTASDVEMQDLTSPM